MLDAFESKGRRAFAAVTLAAGSAMAVAPKAANANGPSPFAAIQTTAIAPVLSNIVILNNPDGLDNLPSQGFTYVSAENSFYSGIEVVSRYQQGTPNSIFSDLTSHIELPVTHRSSGFSQNTSLAGQQVGLNVAVLDGLSAFPGDVTTSQSGRYDYWNLDWGLGKYNLWANPGESSITVTVPYTTSGNCVPGSCVAFAVAEMQGYTLANGEADNYFFLRAVSDSSVLNASGSLTLTQAFNLPNGGYISLDLARFAQAYVRGDAVVGDPSVLPPSPLPAVNEAGTLSMVLAGLAATLLWRRRRDNNALESKVA